MSRPHTAYINVRLPLRTADHTFTPHDKELSDSEKHRDNKDGYVHGTILIQARKWTNIKKPIELKIIIVPDPCCFNI